MNNFKNIFKNNLIIVLLILITITGIYLFKAKNQSEQAANHSTQATIPNIKSQPTKTLVVGTASGYAPFVSVNENGDYEGFDIDVAQALAKQLNLKLEIKDLGSMAPLFMALEQGSIDVIIWGISITQDRLNKVALVRYCGDDTKSFPMIFWKTIPVNIKSINDMQNLTVCVEPASIQDSMLSKYDFIERKFTEKIDDALLNIQYGKADAALVEPAIAAKFKNKYPQIKILEIPLAPEDQIQGMGIVIKKNNLELITQIQQAVQELTKSGEIKKFAESWF